MAVGDKERKAAARDGMDKDKKYKKLRGEGKPHGDAIAIIIAMGKPQKEEDGSRS
tara:strand:+ start:50 stop:214 length:165 start_codon:yes stop_codon:yes gene_type:complete